VLLGLVSSLTLALLVAWLRPPINSYRVGQLVEFVKLKAPVQGCNWVRWGFQEQRRFAELTYSLNAHHYRGEPDLSVHPAPRPSLSPAIDWFLDHEYLATAPRWRPEDDWRLGTGFNVVRMYGWPFGSLWHGETVDGANAGLTQWPWSTFSYGGIKIGMAGPIDHYLPALPHWPGLIANTLLHGAVWFGLTFGMIATRRARRRRRGLCIACRYDLRSTPPDSPCPECGVARA
jgi:hypothetical protein